MVVLDTSFLVDLIRKDSLPLEKLIELEESGEILSTTTINILELFKGVYRSSKFIDYANLRKRYLRYPGGNRCIDRFL